MGELQTSEHVGSSPGTDLLKGLDCQPACLALNIPKWERDLLEQSRGYPGLHNTKGSVLGLEIELILHSAGDNAFQNCFASLNAVTQ